MRERLLFALGLLALTNGRTLVRFGVDTDNVGADPLVIGDPGCPDCSANPGAACANGEFQCSLSGNPRPVFVSSARYELLDMAGNVVALGAKRNYCFNDDSCNPGIQAVFTDCAHDQGLTPGCTDDYEPSIPCQYIDATDVPGITTRAFVIRVTIDPLNVLPDANRNNNVTEVGIPGCGDAIVQPGEQCDDGAAKGTPASCCTAACQFAAAGSTCSGGVCDGMDHCASSPTTTSTSVSSTTTSLPTSTTTTTLPCATVRYTLEASETGPACAGQAIPAVITRKFDRAASLIDAAASSTTRRAQRLRKKASTALKQAKASATRAAARRRTLFPDCAAAIAGAADYVLAGLGV